MFGIFWFLQWPEAMTVASSTSQIQHLRKIELAEPGIYQTMRLIVFSKCCIDERHLALLCFYYADKPYSALQSKRFGLLSRGVCHDELGRYTVITMNSGGMLI